MLLRERRRGNAGQQPVRKCRAESGRDTMAGGNVGCVSRGGGYVFYPKGLPVLPSSATFISGRSRAGAWSKSGSPRGTRGLSVYSARRRTISMVEPPAAIAHSAAPNASRAVRDTSYTGRLWKAFCGDNPTAELRAGRSLARRRSPLGDGRGRAWGRGGGWVRQATCQAAKWTIKVP